MSEFVVTERHRTVLRIVHELDADGCVVGLYIEPLLGANTEDIAWAAWQSAQRRHPWIVGDAESSQIESQRSIAVNQVRNLLTTADELLLAIAATSSIDELRNVETVEKLRAAAVDMRGYMSALQGKLSPPEVEQFNRRISRAG